MANTLTPEELKEFIDYTYKVEEDYKVLTSQFDTLIGTVDQIIEFLPNAIWVLEEDGKVFLQNSKAKELEKLLHILDLEQNDYEIDFQSRSYLVKSSHHNNKLLVSATDITEQKRKENLMTMGQMAAHLSHEIRNPIGSIALLASTLMKKVKSENKPVVFEIQKAIARIERIIKATLMFSKGVKTNFEHIRWSVIIEELHMAIGYYSFSKEIAFNFFEEDFTMEGDVELLSMLFSNFIFNAIDAIEEDEEEEGIISLEFEEDELYFTFKIFDSGIPIKEPENLFQAFKSTKLKGNGLGLILSRQIARAHGGDVALVEGEQKGFVITLKKNLIA